MQAQIDWTQLLEVLCAAFSGFLIRIDRIFRAYSYEHEMLMLDLCDRKGLELEKLPTRSRKIR